jgi:hypothetical protein
LQNGHVSSALGTEAFATFRGTGFSRESNMAGATDSVDVPAPSRRSGFSREGAGRWTYETATLRRCASQLRPYNTAIASSAIAWAARE